MGEPTKGVSEVTKPIVKSNTGKRKTVFVLRGYTDVIFTGEKSLVRTLR